MRNISLAFTRWAFAFSSALQRIPAPITWFAFLLTAGALLALRRPDELLNPYVWAEDGVVNIRDFIDYGARSIFLTVAGYFVLATKLISVTALSISFKHYPVIANWLAFGKRPRILRVKHCVHSWFCFIRMEVKTILFRSLRSGMQLCLCLWLYYGKKKPIILGIAGLGQYLSF